MANLLDMQKILGGIQQQYPVTPPTQPSASIPTPTANPTTGKNETLAMMLYALGGALKGDEDFVVKTLQFKEMQEGKKKEKEQKEAWEKVKQSELIQSNPNIATLANALTPEQGISLAVEMETREPKEKRIYEAADKRKRYVDTGELVFPGVEVPEETLSETQIFAKRRNEVLDRIFSTDPNVYAEFGENAERQKALDEKYYDDVIRKPSFQETMYGNLLPQVEELKTFDNLEEAKKAGLQSGDMLKGKDGKIYKVN